MHFLTEFRKSNYHCMAAVAPPENFFDGTILERFGVNQNFCPITFSKTLKFPLNLNKFLPHHIIDYNYVICCTWEHFFSITHLRLGVCWWSCSDYVVILLFLAFPDLVTPLLLIIQQKQSLKVWCPTIHPQAMDRLHNRLIFHLRDKKGISEKNVLNLVKLPGLAAKCFQLI